jgi:hypothetical protein
VTKPNPLEVLPFLADPKREAEDARLQEIRRASHTRSKLTEEERLVSAGMAREEIARTNLQNMQERRGQGFNRRSWGGATLDMVDEEATKLAEALAMQGKFRDAAAVSPQKTMAKHYESIAEAIERDDDEECGCPELKKRTLKSGQEVVVPRRHIAQRVFSAKHGRLVELEACECGSLQARPARGVLAASIVAQEANRVTTVANREAVAAGRRAAPLIRDGGVLRHG